MSEKLKKFMNIWEIEANFKCPVIGAMLSVEKHKNILKKCGYAIKSLKPYEYHQKIMEKLYDENNVSVKVNNYIRTQARREMIQIADLSEKKIKTIWKHSCTAGNAGAMMYSIIAKQDTSVELMQNVYGEIHMQSHANMTEIFQVRQKLSKMLEVAKKQEKRISMKSQRIKELINIKKVTSKQITLLESTNRTMAGKLLEYENFEKIENSLGLTIMSHENKTADLKKQIEGKQNELRVKEREKRSLQIDLLSSQNENKLLREELDDYISNFKNSASPLCFGSDNCSEESCSKFRLCAKKIFMIGGMTKMKSFYKEMVENAGGIFDYHDGYLKNSNANIEAKVKRCDIVLCPVNCNSHNACQKVKRLCTQHNKDLKILHNSSLSTVSQALFLPGEQQTIN